MEESQALPDTSPPAPPPPSFWGFVAEVQDRIARSFGVHAADREATVKGILSRAPGEATGYWLKLLLAMGIATLGLVLGSKLLATRLMFPQDAPIVLEVVHLGLALGAAAGAELLGERISQATGSELAIHDVPISTEPLVAEPLEARAFLGSMLPRLEHLHESQSLYACVEAPISPSQKPTTEADMVVELMRSLSFCESKRLVVTVGGRWRMVVATEPCAANPKATDASDAGLADGADANRP